MGSQSRLGACAGLVGRLVAGASPGGVGAGERTVVAMADPSVSLQLESYLSGFADVAEFAAGVRMALGRPPSVALDDTCEVLAFLAWREPIAPPPGAVPAAGGAPGVGATVATCWVVTPTMLTRHERRPDGPYLTVTMPVSRIRRVVERGDLSTTTVEIEVEADATVLTAEEATDTIADADGNAVGLRSVSQGRLSPSLFRLAASQHLPRAQLLQFAATVRAVLL